MDEERINEVLERNATLNKLIDDRGHQIDVLARRFDRSRPQFWAVAVLAVLAAIMSSWLTLVTLRVLRNTREVAHVTDVAHAVDKAQVANCQDLEKLKAIDARLWAFVLQRSQTSASPPPTDVLKNFQDIVKGFDPEPCPIIADDPSTSTTTSTTIPPLVSGVP